MAAARLVVVGGNGLVGSAVCRAAARAGIEVCSVSRRGTAPTTAAWASAVEWVQGDALDPSFADKLRGATAVVHTVGTLMENDGYKRLVRSSSDYARYSGANATYESINRDTAVAVARHAEAEGVGAMLFISAAILPPGVDRRYLSTKREAEKSILALNGVRSIVFRPSIMHTDEQPATVALSGALMLANNVVDRLQLGGLRSAAAGVLGVSPDAMMPLPIATVADAVLHAVTTDTVDGIYSPSQIQQLALEPRIG